MFKDATLLILAKGHLINTQLDVYVTSFLPLEALGFLAIVSFVFLAKVGHAHTKEIKKQVLYGAYQQAVKSGDMLRAYETGLAYHSCVKDGQLTRADEEAFHRELITVM
ncbi:hypothetical protein GCM10023189_49210 [Nibrella saemangeumensis]|uniref:Uncharacterized protein n=1 Tax=Nibrella saemangeumensis TaxID=1084526 RepID=A0ABP8NJ36_9BACT